MSENNCKNYPYILRRYTTEESLRKIVNDNLKRICYYYKDESPRHEIKEVISDNEKTLLSDIMYGALLEIRFRNDIKSDDAEFFVRTVISTAETIADRVYKRMFRRRLQGYVSVYLPLWGILDRLVADEGK